MSPRPPVEVRHVPADPVFRSGGPAGPVLHLEPVIDGQADPSAPAVLRPFPWLAALHASILRARDVAQVLEAHTPGSRPCVIFQASGDNLRLSLPELARLDAGEGLADLLLRVNTGGDVQYRVDMFLAELA